MVASLSACGANHNKKAKHIIYQERDITNDPILSMYVFPTADGGLANSNNLGNSLQFPLHESNSYSLSSPKNKGAE